MKKIFLTAVGILMIGASVNAQQENTAKPERTVTKIDKSNVKVSTLPTKTYGKPEAESAPETVPATSPEVKKKEVQPVKRNLKEAPKAVKTEKPVEKQELKKD
jgi:hypothetical protein